MNTYPVYFMHSTVLYERLHNLYILSSNSEKSESSMNMVTKLKEAAMGWVCSMHER